MNLKRHLWWILGLAVIILAVVFVEVRQYNQLCQQIVIHLDDKAEYPFFTKADIRNLVSANGTDHLENTLFREIDLKTIENRVTKNRLIKKCEAFRDISGNLVVDIEQQHPIARLIETSDNEEKTFIRGNYLNDSGSVIPISGRFTARTLLISGDFFRNLGNLKTEKGKQLVELLNLINKNPYWKAQVAEMIVGQDGEITIIPQVGRHIIEFGSPNDAEAKFNKLNVFYKMILPVKGWEHYQHVSVKYRNQIVCDTL
jgi:cell division protein FtsQ